MKLSKIKTDSSEVNRIQDNTSTVLDYIQLSNLTGPQSKVEGITLSTSPKQVSHKLGRIPTGYIIIRQDSPETIYEPTASTSPSLTIVLQATGDVIASMIFF